MRSRVAISTVSLAVFLMAGSHPAVAQTVLPPLSGAETWGYKLESGFFWGQLFGGLSAENDKKTFKRVRAEIWKNTTRLTVGNPGSKSLLGQTPRSTGPQSQTSQAGLLQFGGGIGITRFGFPEEAVDFFGESGFTVTTIMGGARYVLPPQPKFLVFVQGQAGLERSFGESAFAFAPEGGVIVPVNKDLFLTLTGGLRTAFYEGDSGTAFELNVGLTFPFGHK
jgi:hypothetical protein